MSVCRQPGVILIIMGGGSVTQRGFHQTFDEKTGGSRNSKQHKGETEIQRVILEVDRCSFGLRSRVLLDVVDGELHGDLSNSSMWFSGTRWVQFQSDQMGSVGPGTEQSPSQIYIRLFSARVPG
ncbi:hypothetical protein NQZ68_040308 [Dissostichus eleginoides]|nr:hypothetical protein NQZ68_040308 [Dissostichus eleginoides]